MKTCPKCGRANQPTRKYCIRCGGLLISAEPKPQTVSSVTETPEPEVKATQPPTSSTSEARVTTNDEWVKPSQVARDRIRSGAGLSKPKSELEKAREAFARAEEVGIEETGEGIIETRMLRASEVQELMGDLEKQHQSAETQPATQPPTSPPLTAAPPTSAPPTPTADAPPSAGPPGAPPGTQPGAPPGASPSTTKAPTPVQKEVIPPPEKMSTPEPKPVAPSPKSMMPDITAKPPGTAAPPAKTPVTPTRTSIPEVKAVLSTIPDPEYLKDSQLKDIINDLTNLHTELTQFNSDLENVRSRLEYEVRDYWNVAEVKRIQFESIEEQLRLAKQEWNDLTKVYQQADKRMKNEISSREKRIKDIEKRIEKTESSFEKRVKELEKEKEKLAQSG
jgi:hypothetical protein